MSDCPTCLPADCGLTNDLDIYSLESPLYPFVLNCPPGSNCNGTGDNGEIQVTCGNDFVPVAIPAGATLEQKLALIGKALAGCGPKRVFDQPGPDNPGPIDPNGPPVQLYYSRSATCTVYCSEVVTVVDGAPVVTRSGPFTFTFPDGAFIGGTQLAADNAAKALACIRARQHRFCLSAIQKAFCMGEGFTATIKATGQYISQFPFSDYWEVTAGLPPGLTFHGGFITGGKAVIDGTPTTAGLYTFTVKVTLGSGLGQGDHMAQVYTMAIVEIDTATPLPELVIGTPYTKSLTVIPTHDQETEAWSVVGGALPHGIALTTEGILHGTPTEAGEFPFTAQVTAIINGTSITCEKDFTFEVMPEQAILTTNIDAWIATLPNGGSFDGILTKIAPDLYQGIAPTSFGSPAFIYVSLIVSDLPHQLIYGDETFAVKTIWLKTDSLPAVAGTYAWVSGPILGGVPPMLLTVT